MEQKKTYRWLEIIAVSFIIAASFTAKIVYLNMNFARFLEGNELTEKVMLYGEKIISYTIYGSQYLYEAILRGLFSFIGNKPVAAVVLQIIMQCIVLLLLYFSTRALIGKTAAFFLLLCLAPISYVTEALTEQFLLFIFSIYFFIAAMLWIGVLRKETKSRRYLKIMFSALAVSSFAYFDIIGIVFAVITGIGVLLFAKKERFISLFLYCIFTILGYFIMLSIKMLYHGNSLAENFMEYGRAYFGKVTYQIDFITKLDMENNLLIGFAAAIILCFLIGLWGIVKGNVKAGLLFTMFLLTIFIGKILNIGSISYTPILVVMFVFLIANGVQALIPSKKIKIVEKEEPKKTESMKEKVIIPPEQGKPVIQYLENPLPVPKRHVSKEMEFALEPSARDMKFDIENLCETDDFDI